MSAGTISVIALLGAFAFVCIWLGVCYSELDAWEAAQEDLDNG